MAEPTLFNWRQTRQQEADDAVALQRFLAGKRWLRKPVIVSALGWNERRIQAAKETANGAIISSSKLGYCLASEATRDEALAALHEMRDRIRTMSGNYVKELRRFHSHQVAA
jgi:hypothetical protein